MIHAQIHEAQAHAAAEPQFSGLNCLAIATTMSARPLSWLASCWSSGHVPWPDAAPVLATWSCSQSQGLAVSAASQALGHGSLPENSGWK